MRIACIGECMVELTLPREDGAGSRVGFAGDTLNVAVYLKRAAPEAGVAYVTALGTDPLSARMLAFFAGEGLDTGLIERRADRVPGLYAISLDAGGERSFTYWRDSSAARTLFLPPAEVTPDRLAGFDLDLSLRDHPGDPGAGRRGRRSRASSPATGRAAGGSRSIRTIARGSGRTRRRRGARSARFWALTDIALPSLDDEMALFGDAGAGGGAGAARRGRGARAAR